MERSSKERVVLVHGLAESPLTMARLEVSLRQANYDVANVAYPSTFAPIPELVDDFIAPMLDAHRDAPKLHFVTHSLGGVLLHACLQDRVPENLGRVVMTAPGLHGSDALEVYRRSWIFRMLFGPAAFQSGTGDDAFANGLAQAANYELGVIAGCVSLDPIANLFIPWPHDGKISVSRTKLQNMADHIVLPVSHDFTASDPLAIFQIKHFLKNGHFLHLFHQAQSTDPISSAA